MIHDAEDDVASSRFLKREFPASLDVGAYESPRSAQRRRLDSLCVKSVRLESIPKCISTDSDSLEMAAGHQDSPLSVPWLSHSLSADAVQLESLTSTDSEHSTTWDHVIIRGCSVDKLQADEDQLLAEILAGAVMEAAWRRQRRTEDTIVVAAKLREFCATRISSTVGTLFLGE